MKSKSLKKSKLVSGAISCLLLLSASPMVMPAANAYDVQSICKAVRENDEVVFDREIKSYINALGTDGLDKPMNERFGWTALHLAVKSGNATMVQSLRSLLANPNVKDFKGMTPLHYAVLQGNVEIVRILLNNPSGTVKLETPTGVVGYSRLEEYMQKTKLKLTDTKDNLGRTPLHYAILNDNINIAEALINVGVDVNEATDDGLTPLAMAVVYGRSPKFLKLLTEKNATFGTIPARYVLQVRRKLDSALWDAVYLSDWNTVNVIIDSGLNVNIDGSGRPLLNFAIEAGELELAEKLIRKGANVNAIGDLSHDTPLICAACRGSSEIVRMLLDRGARETLCVHERSRQYTALHFAASSGNLETVKLLIEAGMDVNTEAFPGETPLYAAIECGYWHIAQELIKKGAKTSGDFKFNNHFGTLFETLVNAKQWDLLLKLVREKKCNVGRDELSSSLRNSIISGGETGTQIIEEIEKSWQ